MKWIELTTEMGPVSIGVEAIAYFVPYSKGGTSIFLSEVTMFHVRESYEEVKALLRDSRTGSAGIRVVKPKRTLKFKKEDT